MAILDSSDKKNISSKDLTEGIDEYNKLVHKQVNPFILSDLHLLLLEMLPDEDHFKKRHNNRP